MEDEIVGILLNVCLKDESEENLPPGEIATRQKLGEQTDNRPNFSLLAEGSGIICHPTGSSSE